MRDERPAQASDTGWDALESRGVPDRACLGELACELLAVRRALESLIATRDLAAWHQVATRAALAEVDEAQRILDQLCRLDDPAE